MAVLPTIRPFGVDYFVFGFHVSGKMWDWYRMSDLTPASSPAYAMRALADRINLHREPGHAQAVPVVYAGQLLGMGVLTDVLRYLSDYYCVKSFPDSLIEGLDATGNRLGANTTEQSLSAFVRLYTPQAIRQGSVAKETFLDATRREKNTRYVVGRETLLLHLSMINRALAPFVDLYDDGELKRQSAYESVVGSLGAFFASRAPFPGTDKDLLNFLQMPMRACPDSIEGQLAYILEHWANLLPPELLEVLQFTRGVLKEETQMRGLGPGPARVLEFGEFDWGYAEPARFTIDKDWMSNVVLIAKSTYVWLDQLSKKYQRPIAHLNDIPDEELDRLANWGFTGLWLIGVWERSSASQKIKQWMGNPEALPSAYSLYDYVIAADLGGEAAYNDLRDRAWQRGIRLASDMVPNHVGLYSRWLIEHPDWFLQLPYPPFPSYTFNGGDLSDDPRVGLFIEDGYWNHSDAAVVFKRHDRWTGDTRYIYHGNDGTSMPWNDTAQLNFLIAEVREAVIQTILHVVRKFPIIRFDAAMTLTKRHFQRLWFPKPGDGGAIPSRAEHGMSKSEFDKVFPAEFWREVVDRVQAEAPETLLIAEAFWLMEGYFVRTLGMHRVYNSAFMNMLKMEENAKYRTTIRNVLEFSPEVLKRFTNFMNNPDEQTAIEQFGKEDKYYGVAMLMVTMPGLPMFGHGQIEGFTEKYGMEYRRAYWDEHVDEHMIWRHEQEIFPLMRRRRLFSGVDRFALYDFVTPAGWVDENVFAYSNRAGNDRAVIIYNNAYATTSGTINLSVSYNVGDAENKDLRRSTLAQALGLDTGENCYYVFRDHRTKLEYIRQGAALAREGMTVTLHAYGYNAFLDFREIRDMDGAWGRLAYSLEGRGVPNMDEAYAELILQPVHNPLRKVMTAEKLRQLAAPMTPAVRAEFKEGMRAFFRAVTEHTPLKFDEAELLNETLRELDALHSFKKTLKETEPEPAIARYLVSAFPKKPTETLDFWRIPVALIITHQITREYAAFDFGQHQRRRADDLLLDKVVTDAIRALGVDEKEAALEAQLIRALATHAAVLDFAPLAGGTVAIRRMFEDPAVQQFLFMNRYGGQVWINKEQCEKLLYWLLFESALSLMLGIPVPLSKEALEAHYENAQEILTAAQKAGYNMAKFFVLLGRQEQDE